MILDDHGSTESRNSSGRRQIRTPKDSAFWQCHSFGKFLRVVTLFDFAEKRSNKTSVGQISSIQAGAKQTFRGRFSEEENLNLN